MEICFETVNGVQVAHLQCYLDQMGAENFKFVLLERMEEGKTMILDLEKLVNIDSFGLDVLLAVAQKAIERKADIKLANVSPDMQIVLDITKAYRVFDIYPTVAEAAASCQEAQK